VNVARVVACELVCGAQAIEFRAPLVPGNGAAAVHHWVRGRIPKIEADRPLGDAIESLAHELLEGALDPVVQPHLGEGALP
jgi:histidine ammonia-lyase